jgi:type IV pilus assembly protein PilV
MCIQNGICKTRFAQVSGQSGFGLFEILITIVIVAIGLLGLAAMQATGLKNNQSAYRGSQATVLAYDIADRMRTNTTAINNYLTSYMTLAEAVEQGAVDSCKTTTGCTAAELAQTDLVDWSTALEAQLPGPVGDITLNGTTYTVTVGWDEDQDGEEDDLDDVQFQFSFQP